MFIMQDSAFRALLIVVTLYLVACLTRAFWTAYRRGLRDIPGPQLAKWSSLYRLKYVWTGLAHEQYREIHAKYGPIVRTAPNVVDISDPTMIPKIYGITSKFVKSQFFSTLAVHYEYKPVNSMFTETDPEVHRALKKPVAQKFSMSSIRTLEPLVDPCSQLFHDAMMDLAGQKVDLGAWVQWYAFDVIGAITFSQQFGFMENREDVSNMIEGIEFGLHYAGIIGQVPWLHRYLLGNMTLIKLRAKLLPNAPDPVRTATQMVFKSLNDYDQRTGDLEDGRQDFLTFLRQQEKSTGVPIPQKDMWNHLMNNLLAGSDTTAIALRAVFYYLIQNSAVYQRLRQEIDDADGAGKLSRYVTYSESLELAYLQLVIKEAMRMSPGVGYPLERIVPSEGAELCGHHVPGGTIVGMNAAVIHRDKTIFGQDADVFRPERWMESSSGDIERIKEMDRTLLTFGAGARTCIGKNISIMEMGKFVPQVLRDFDVVWASDKPEWTIRTYWFSRQSDLNVVFIPRRGKAETV